MIKLFFLLIWLLYAIVLAIVTQHQSQQIGKSANIGYAVSAAYVMYVGVQIVNQFNT